MDEIGKSRQIYNLRKTGFSDAEIARLMVISKKRVEKLGEVGQVVEELTALEEASHQSLSLSDADAEKLERVLSGVGERQATRPSPATPEPAPSVSPSRKRRGRAT
jgi:hypothetical protein